MMHANSLISSEILSALFDISPSGIAIADEKGRYVQVNDAYCRIFGFCREALIGRTFGITLLDEDKAIEPVILKMALDQDQSAPTEWRVKHKDGRVLFVHSAFKTFFSPDGGVRILTILSDVSTLVSSLRAMQEHEAQLHQANERLEAMVISRTMLLEHANQELARLATEDPLAGIYNRRAFEAEALKAIANADRHARPISLLFLDIDHFKSINDRFGHAAGDVVIQKVAAHIKDLLRSSDLLARWGGEEFVLLLPDTTLAQAIIVGEKILATVRTLTFPQAECMITISAGVVERSFAQSLEETLIAADQLLYQAKHAGRDRLEWVQVETNAMSTFTSPFLHALA